MQNSRQHPQDLLPLGDTRPSSPPLGYLSPDCTQRIMPSALRSKRLLAPARSADPLSLAFPWLAVPPARSAGRRANSARGAAAEPTHVSEGGSKVWARRPRDLAGSTSRQPPPPNTFLTDRAGADNVQSGRAVETARSPRLTGMGSPEPQTRTILLPFRPAGLWPLIRSRVCPGIGEADGPGLRL